MLTYLLYGEVRVLSLQLLVHRVSEDDPAVHRARCFLCANSNRVDGSCSALGTVCLGRLGLTLHLRQTLQHLGFRHLDECVMAIAAIQEGEGDRLSHLLN